MWRSLFLAVGIAAAIGGAECMVIDKAILKPRNSGEGQSIMSTKEWVPPEWAPWTLLTGGALVVLYTYTLPGRTA